MASGSLQARDPILGTFKGASGASKGGSWSDLGKLWGALKGPYGDQVGLRRPPEARKKRRLQEPNFEGLLESLQIQKILDFVNQSGAELDENRKQN